MGYRSSLYFKCTNDIMPEFYQLLSEHDFLSCLSNVHQSDTYTSFEMHGLKWYDGYKDVDAINAFIHKHTPSDRICMLRDGEDNHDIEVIGDLDSFGVWYHQETVVNDLHEGSPGFHLLERTNPELFI